MLRVDFQGYKIEKKLEVGSLRLHVAKTLGPMDWRKNPIYRRLRVQFRL